MKSFNIHSSNGPYPVEFAQSIKNYRFSKIDQRSDYVIVADKQVWQKAGANYLDWVNFPKYLVEASEETKTLEEVNKLANWMVQNNCTKTTTIVAFGGGVIQDLVTFTARIYHRGCFWEFHPTTLLSQADSCIGSKCGINVLPHKNQLGTVYAPSRVVINHELLSTLSVEEILSGLGEIIKLAVTGPGQFYSELKNILEIHYPNLPTGEDLKRIIFLSLQAKKFIIEEDEHERGPRRILNYGHSFGHALESLSNNRISHGRAIVFGMDLINFLGVQWGITDDRFYRDFRKLLKRYFGDTKMPKGISASDLVSQLKTDKKMAYGVMNFAIPLDAGVIKIVPKQLDEDVERLVRLYLSESNVFSSH